MCIRDRAVTWGHIHGEFSAHRGKVQLLAAPATCVQFKAVAPTPQTDELPPGYRWFELYPDGTMQTGVQRVDLPVHPLGLTPQVPA